MDGGQFEFCRWLRAFVYSPSSSYGTVNFIIIRYELVFSIIITVACLSSERDSWTYGRMDGLMNDSIRESSEKYEREREKI